MAIDFTLTPELEDIRLRVRVFIDEVVKPAEANLAHASDSDRRGYVKLLVGLRAQAKEAGMWLPHMPTEYGGMGLGHVQLAMV